MSKFGKDKEMWSNECWETFLMKNHLLLCQSMLKNIYYYLISLSNARTTTPNQSSK